MVNSNPETVSTDYDTSDRLYFEPLTLEDVLEIVSEPAHAKGLELACSVGSGVPPTLRLPSGPCKEYRR